MRAHTVILGAGATMAAIPNGDRNGRKSSVMNGLIEKLNLQDILNGIDLHTKSDNLEDIYSELYSRPDCQEACQELEKRLYSHHYKYTNSFFDSYLGIFPRRSCEAVFTMFMGNIFMDNTRGFKAGMTWDDIKALMRELLIEERSTPEGENYPAHYTPRKSC